MQINAAQTLLQDEKNEMLHTNMWLNYVSIYFIDCSWKRLMIFYALNNAMSHRKNYPLFLEYSLSA